MNTIFDFSTINKKIGINIRKMPQRFKIFAEKDNVID